MGAQKNSLIETGVLSTQNTMFKLMDKKIIAIFRFFIYIYIFFFFFFFCFTGPMGKCQVGTVGTKMEG